MSSSTQQSALSSSRIGWVNAGVVWNIGIVLLVLTVFLARSSIADPDLWWHLRAGLDMLSSGGLIRVDSYSYLTGGQIWINHEWLAEVLFALVYSAGGTAGLALFRLVISFTVLGVCFWYLSRHRVSVMQSAVLLLFASLCLYSGVGTVRPQMFTFLFFLLILLAICAAERGQIRLLWLLPPVFVAWANLHGGFLVGLGTLLVWACFHLLIERRGFRQILLPVVLSVLAVLINPYGLDLAVFLLRSYAIPRPYISEWSPIAILSANGAVFLALLVLTGASLLKARRKVPAALTFLFCLFAVAPLVSARHLPLFAIAAVVIAGQAVGEATAVLFDHIKGASYTPLASILPLLSAIALSLLMSRNASVIQVDSRNASYPAAAVATLKASGASGNLLIPYNWGSYAVWQLGPEVKVSVDSRETVYSERILAANFAFELGIGEWDTLLMKYPTEMVLVNRKTAAYNLMRLEPGWVSVYEDPVAAIFVPQDSPLVEKIRRAPKSNLPPDGNGLEFP